MSRQEKYRLIYISTEVKNQLDEFIKKNPRYKKIIFVDEAILKAIQNASFVFQITQQ